METIYSNAVANFKLLNGIVLIPAVVNDEQGHLIFDTGANTCLLRTALQNRLSVQPMDGATNVFSISSVSLQKHPYSNVISVFTDISAIQSQVSVLDTIFSRLNGHILIYQIRNCTLKKCKVCNPLPTRQD